MQKSPSLDFLKRSCEPKLMRMAMILKCFGGGSAFTSSTRQPSTTAEDLCHRFSLSQLRKSTHNFEQSQIIGDGGTDVVYRACVSINGQFKDLALKRFRQGIWIPSELWLPEFKNNIIYRCLVHYPNLSSLVGFCDDHNELIVVYDYPQNISLHHQLYGAESNSPTLSWKKRLEIVIGVARGLHYLHSGTKRTIIHRDVNPQTILLDENWVPKLEYSGISIKGPKFSAKDVKPIEWGVAGTWGYAAPEHVKEGSVTHKLDVYAFGSVLFEVIFGEPLREIISQHYGVDDDHTRYVRNLVETGKAAEIIDQSLVGQIAPECWKLYMEIAQSCMSKDPDERPDMGDVEVQLERLLQLQEEADANHASRASFLV